jgi:hypothetical protein
MKIKEFNAETGKEIIRDATDAELDQAKLDAIEAKRISDAKTAKEAEKAALLEQLGITADQAKLLLS